MNKIRKFFRILWDYIKFPYYWLTTRKIDRKLNEISEEDKNSLITEKDVEFLKDIGIETDLERIILGDKKADKSKRQG